MPLIPEEPQIHESVPGPRATPAAGRTAPTPRPVPGPGPRPAPRRPGSPGPNRGSAGTSSAQSQRAASDATKPSPTAPAAPAAKTTPAAKAAPQIQLIPATVDGALDAADEAVDLLLDSGRAPGDILVLTTGEQHPWAAHELSFGEASYWAQHDAGDDVFYATASAGRVKGRPVVVVAVNGGANDAVARALPEAMGRAGALLIVCGDPKRINTLIGSGA
ncbi:MULTISPECIES: hypothetical protein [Streptomyces]|uniref:Uncharacterized protein n=1 Tax=Streptomyces hygroscopicus TaxID=1912 RepID=A0ABQ3U8C3_STRHY|nr:MULTISPECIES: hypothetical protein [Streptomyces]MBW8087783.1 hypothetical protein [Streptomyces hygroscopicus subsp. hygroscopicus]MCO8303035.1 hypothetical protein [Streptomyces sp. RKCA744]MDN3056541.1 hypothetical protein [Streptomyces sp. SRF1]GHJ31863.1 hypothetical protein TPA0910_62960 [Streptomyces hygroscopicus]